MFLPLKSVYFEAFVSGTKTTERRMYGVRWNEKTCTPGRQITISRGYSGDRITGTVAAFRRTWGTKLAPDVQAEILKCYGSAEIWVAEIDVSGLTRPGSTG